MVSPKLIGSGKTLCPWAKRLAELTIWEPFQHTLEAACLESFYFDVIFPKSIANLTRR